MDNNNNNNNISRYVLLILITLSCSSCFYDENQETESDTNCAPNEYYYLLTTEREQCFAEEIPLIGCFPIDKEGSDNLLAEYCKESDEGMNYIVFDSLVQIHESGWTQCPTEYIGINIKSAHSIDELEEEDCFLQPESEYTCTPDGFAYLLTYDGINCKAEHYTLDSCVFMSTDSSNNGFVQYCKETIEGTVIIRMGSAHSILGSEWEFCSVTYISDDPDCTTCCILEEK
jgi:hypothetical protein